MANIIGADKFIAAVSGKANAAPKKVANVLRSETAAMQSQAQRLEPVRTGNLRRSTNISVTTSGNTAIGTVTANAYNKSYNYGYAQENGTRYIRGKHFMETAFNAHSQSFKQKMSEVLK